MKRKYELVLTGQFKKNVKLCKKRGLPLDELWLVIAQLLDGKELDERYQAHILKGDRKDQWKCHVRPNWLLIWEQREKELILVMLNTGTHSDIFEKKSKK